MAIHVPKKQFASANEALAFVSLELAVDGEDVEIVSSEGVSVHTKEFLDYDVKFKPGYNNVITLPSRKFPIRGARAEFLWYMTMNNSVEPILKYLKNWSRFANKDGKVNSNYGCYWKTGVPNVIQQLTADKHSRRAGLTIFNHCNSSTFGKDTPCTLNKFFHIRDNKLHMRVHMRSNDIWYGFSIDQFCNSLLHQLVLNELRLVYPDLELGWYSHTTDSMHVYTETVSPTTLCNVFNEFTENNDTGRRIQFPDHITFSNFWDNIADLSDIFPIEMLEHFKQFVK